MMSESDHIESIISLYVCHWYSSFASSHAVYSAFPLFMMTIQDNRIGDKDNRIGDEGMLALAPVLGQPMNLTTLHLPSILQL